MLLVQLLVVWLAAGESTGAAGAVTVATAATVSECRAREREGAEA